MLTANAIMTPFVQTIKKDTPVVEAIDLMLSGKISGMPVVDDENMVIGIVTEKDIITLYDKTAQVHKMKIGDIMTKDVVCFNINDSIKQICDCLIKNDFRRVPVVSDGKLVGIISRSDVTRGILNRLKRRSEETLKPSEIHQNQT